jgi:transposase InsO family protein
VRFRWIHEHRRDWPVEASCEVLGVARSGYYAWRDRRPSEREKRRRELAVEIRKAHMESRGAYGSPRIHAELAGNGVAACENTVAKIMRQEGISSKRMKKRRVRTTDSDHALPVARNLLERRFDWESPDQAWATDITYIPTGEGFLYLAAVIDLCSRRIVGWSMADHMRADLCLDALKMALAGRDPGRELLHHSDRGSQYACVDYQRLLQSQGIACSMSRRGDCWDNAAMESFWSTLKSELVHHQDYATLEEARRSIFEWIECWYNRRRRHSAIGYMSPEAFEASLS